VSPASLPTGHGCGEGTSRPVHDLLTACSRGRSSPAGSGERRLACGSKLARVDGAASVERSLSALDAGAERLGAGRWGLELECGGLPLRIELTLRDVLLRAEAVVLPPETIDPRQLLFWNGQAPLVCFAHGRAGEVIACGELPVAALDGELLDRFLGLLHASALRARQFVLGG
jgi:hypothetical protein